jgi:hypothetical protein
LRQLIVLGALLATGFPAPAQQETPPPRPERPADASPPPAEANTAREFFRFSFNFYSQDDGGGNPNLPEDMTVLEPQILWSKSLSATWTLSLKLQADIISAASVERGKRFPPGTQSGATGDKYFGVDAGAFYAWSDQMTIGAGVTGSTEYDYTSFGTYLKWTYDTESKNDTFVARLSAYFDTLDLIRFTGLRDGSDQRTSASLGLGWTHILGPDTVSTLNWDITTQSGFLSTPYNSVVAAGTEVEEVLPDSRFRNSVHVRVRHLLFEDLAVEPGVGAYFDDWGSRAFNAEIAVWWELVRGLVIVRPSYRYHTQGEVDFFVNTSAATIPKFRTQDSDLADFNSHTIGLKFIFPKFTLLGENHELEVGVDYSKRSDHLDSFGTTVGYQWRF